MGDCRLAEAPKLDLSSEGWATEEQERRTRRRRTLGKQQQLLLMLGAGVALAGIVLAVQRFFSAGGEGPTSELLSPAVVEHRAELDRAYSDLKTTLTAPSWGEMRKGVRDADRIRPLMEWYYGLRPYAPRRLKGYSRPTAGLTGGNPVVTMQVESDSGTLHVLLEQMPSGWKLDWESFTNVHGIRWHAFLHQEGGLGTAAEFPLHVEVLPLSHLTPTFYNRSGLQESSVQQAARLFVSDRDGGYAAACFPAQAPLAVELLGNLERDQVVKFTLEVTLKSAEAYPPSVEVTRVVQRGWNSPVAPPSPPTH